MTTMMTAANGDAWKIYGIYAIPSDPIFQVLQQAIDSGNPRQDELQKKTGHMSPIVIDCKNHTMNFQKW